MSVPPDNGLREPLSRVFERVAPQWKQVTDAFLASPAGGELARYVDRRVAEGAVVYPANVFRALELTPPSQVRVVILGQDPYHGPGQAQGLAFSVSEGQKLPPSLRNMLQEVQADTGLPSQCRGDLSAWARQGVLLLNTALTVEDGLPQSHAGRGWEALTDALLAHVAAQPRPVVFLLWGAAAQRKRALVERPPHRVLTANHPSPLSARRPPQPFIGCGHFSQANALLRELRPDTPPIVW
ncbi:uracil-DNA glycosylase [Piscinibacter sp. XHJ-5]|uniref:uracil-DNA glycosylase n=1 Tax=Piscinibacter sp. XHJ-5 TaxID=3037797 RepID=UPI002452EFCF|nr:uracil-DNA glycosylase [Piscinibacter sp. XHJ-5]